MVTRRVTACCFTTFPNAFRLTVSRRRTVKAAKFAFGRLLNDQINKPLRIGL